MKEQTCFVKTTHVASLTDRHKPSYIDQISSYKATIQNIKKNHQKKLSASKFELQNSQIIKKPTLTKPSQNIHQQKLLKSSHKMEDQKNKKISDTDKMLYEKKFKNFLNHRQEFQALAKQKRQKIMQDRKQKQKGHQQIEYDYGDQSQILKDTTGQNLFRNAQDMLGFYEEITFGKKNKKGSTKLYHGEKIEEKFRKGEFQYLMQIEAEIEEINQEKENKKLVEFLSKDTFLNYLFNQPAVMMLYSINPYQLGDELAEFQTFNPGWLSFQDFSKFLLLDREPTYFQYSKENLEEARKTGRGIKCQPIIPKWIGDDQIYDWLLQTFRALDILGESNVQKEILVKKLRKEGQRKRIIDQDIIEIVNINKLITLDRILYQIQHTTQFQDNITQEYFVGLINHYHRLHTPEKDKLITKLILNGKYDPSYIFILGNQALQVIKETFNSLQKFAQYFVTKQKFVEKIIKNPKFNKIRHLPVRSQGNRYVKMQSVETTLTRFLIQAESYVDIEEILDFFTNRGRPRKIQHKIYLINLENQLRRIQQDQKRKKEKKLSQGDLSTSSDQQEFQKSLKEKKIQRKKQKLAAIRASDKFTEGKKFNVTVPETFSFGDGVKQKSKVSIRQKKLKQQLEQKNRLQKQSMVPIKPKPVPQHVKEDLYEKINKEQERQRKQRLQRFRLQSQQKMQHISPHLLSKPKSKSIYEVRPKQYKFVAKPLPWYCEVNLLERIQIQKDQRRQRILEEIINKHNDIDIPQGFKRMIERGQKGLEEKQRMRALSRTTANDKQCTFNPKISRGIPDFKMIHEHLQIDLENKKQQKQPIQIIPFSFQNRPSRSKTAIQPRPKQYHHKAKQVEHKQQDQQINIPITQKHLAFVNLRRKQQEEKNQKLQQEKRASTVRKMRQQKFAPYVREVLRKSRIADVSHSKALIESKIKEFKKQERKRKRQYEQEMIKIYTKVFNRPLLVEGQGQLHTKIQNQQRRDHSIHNQKSNKRQQKERPHPKQNIEQYAEDYNLSVPSGVKYQKRKPNQNQIDDLRRKAIEHPPRNYLMQEPNGYENEEEEQNQEDQYDFEGEYLSENGRYTN